MARTPLVGREQERDMVETLLGRDDIRLLTLTGLGGIGKTRLALQVAADLSGRFADGVVVVPLAFIRDPDLVLPTIAQSLEVPDAPGHPLVRRLRGFLHDRQLLLVLDNLEHLLDATPDVANLLDHAPGLKILATSRTRLAVSGERTFPVPPLTETAARHLFTDRAQALDPTFALTNETTPVIDEICARLDRLPLAIELAAARIPVLPPRALLTRLEHRLDVLADGPRDVPARLRNMRDAIGWSHDLLPSADQVLFRRLGVFNGGFTLEAAQAIAGEGKDVFRGVDNLVGAHLLHRIQGARDAPRFTMLETIREYAIECLVASGEAPPIRSAHAEYYRWLAESALPHYDGPELGAYNERVDRELDNCRVAMAWALESDAAETGVRLAGALWRVWWYGLAAGGKPWWDRVREGRSWCERMLLRRDGLPVEALTEAFTGAGFLALIQLDQGPVQRLGEELLARARAEHYPYGQWWALYLLGSLAEQQERDDAAVPRFEEALALAPSVRNPENHAAMSLSNLGQIAERAGDLVRAAALLEDALALCRRSGNPGMLTQVLHHLGVVRREQGAWSRAVPLLREALVVLMEQADSGGMNAALVELSIVAASARQLEVAARLLAAADTFPGHLGYRGRFDDAVSSTRTSLDGAAFAAAWEAGRLLAWDELLSQVDALAAIVAETQPDSSAKAQPDHGLSPRELEVLRLLAEGRSNRAIAESLSLSERTVEAHVLHVLAKLGLESRTAAATWAVRRGLA